MKDGIEKIRKQMKSGNLTNETPAEEAEGKKNLPLRFQGSWPGPEGYPRVLDYSIFKSLLVPYSKILLLDRVGEK